MCLIHVDTHRPANARIAICGDTFDERLPLSQSASGWSAHNPDHATGFLAVYDGDGLLQWTHHFYAGNDGSRDCAITDVSIRVDAEGNEIVTYCGISSHGDPGTTEPLSPFRPFDSPIPGLLSAGDTTQTGGQWDGFVGRLRRDSGAGSTTHVFHSIVGGPGQDGLFGLAEITEHRFAVVGSTDAAIGQEGFPITFQGAPVLTAPYRVGVVMVFDAEPTTVGNPLLLESSCGLGRLGEQYATLARDVCIGQGVGFDDGESLVVENVVYVVGSTNDDQFETSGAGIGLQFLTPPTAGQGNFGGLTDGFVAVFRDQLATPAPSPTLPTLRPETFSYWGHDTPQNATEDGLTGINNWNEFSEHVAVTGFTSVNLPFEIGASTFFYNTAYGPFVGNPANNNQELIRVRDDVIGGNTDDRPAFPGRFNANGPSPATGLTFETHGLGHVGAGGVAVGNDGRVNVVGRTSPADGSYPVTAMHPVARMADLGQDAVRTEVDLLPASPVGQPGIARTDGTGFQGNGLNHPLPDYWGTTTPRCGLDPYGRRIGQSVPAVSHMLIDYEGSPPASLVNDAAITVTRPTTYAGSLTIGVLWFGFPVPSVPINGVEFWANPSTWNLFYDPWPGDRPYRLPLGVMQGSGVTVSAQLHCLLDITGSGGPLGFGLVHLGPGCDTEFTASPALWFSY